MGSSPRPEPEQEHWCCGVRGERCVSPASCFKWFRSWSCLVLGYYILLRTPSHRSSYRASPWWSSSLVVYSCRGQKSCLTLGALSLCLAACVINHVLSSAWHFQPGFWGCGVNNFRGRISCGYKHNSWKQRVSGVLGRQGRSQRSAMLSRVFSVCR